MNKIISFLLTLPILLGFISCTQSKYDIGIIAGTVINGTGSPPQKNQLILINQGVIVDIVDGKDAKKYKIKTLIDASNKYLIPGLFDMHGHVTMTSRTVDTLSNNFQFKVMYDRESAEWTLRSLIFFGIVTVRETADFTEEAHQLKTDLSLNKIIGPTIFTCGPLIESGTPSFLTMSSLVNTEAEAVNEVQEQVKAGVDFIKIYQTVPPELTKVIIEEAHKNDKRVLGHLGKTTWLQAIQYNIDGIVHAGGLSPEFSNRDSLLLRLKMMKEKEIANDPTLYVFKCVLHQDTIPSQLIEWMPSKMKDCWNQESSAFNKKIIPNIIVKNFLQRNMNYVTEAYNVGINILAGSDFNNSNTYPGYSLHKELQLLSEAGIPNDSLIKIATFNAAKWLGVSDKQGTIEKSKQADIVILNRNPLDDISNTLEISDVVFKGNRIERDILFKNN